MALKDMSLSPEEAKEQDCCAPACGYDKDSGPKYPWGLSINLDDGSLAKLGFGLMPVGTEIMVTAMARVTSTSMNEREGSDPETSMGLQIVSMDLGTPQADRMAATAKRLYKD